MNLKKDLVRVGTANSLILISGVINAFVVPKILNINDYANYKTYLLYISYLGLFHFGFVDGIHVTFVGRCKLSTDKIEEYRSFFFFFLSFQILVLSILFSTSIFIESDKIIRLTILSIIPVNVNSFLQFFYQSIGDFRRYSKVLIITPIIFIITVVFFYNNLSLNALLLLYIVSSGATLFYGIAQDPYLNYKSVSSVSRIINSFLSIKHKILPRFKTGFIFLLGNLIFILFFDLGRVYTKLFKSAGEFAYYSFAVTLMTLFVVIVNSLNKTLYPYLFKITKSQLDILFKYLTYFGCLGMLSFYLIDYIVNQYLTEYIPSLGLTGILFSTIPGAILIKSVYHNKYRIEQLEKEFLIDSIKFLIMAGIITLIFSYFFLLEIIDIGLICTAVIYMWTLFPNKKLKVKTEISSVKWVLFLNVLGFLVVHLSPLNTGAKLLLSTTIVLTLILLKEKFHK